MIESKKPPLSNSDRQRAFMARLRQDSKDKKDILFMLNVLISNENYKSPLTDLIKDLVDDYL